MDQPKNEGICRHLGKLIFYRTASQPQQGPTQELNKRQNGNRPQEGWKQWRLIGGKCPRVQGPWQRLCCLSVSTSWTKTWSLPCSLDHWPAVLSSIFDVCTYLISNWIPKDVDRPTGLQSFHATSFQWDGWMASLTRWTWVWANYGRWWWTGKPGMLQSMGSRRVRHSWVTEQQQLPSHHSFKALSRYWALLGADARKNIWMSKGKYLLDEAAGCLEIVSGAMNILPPAKHFCPVENEPGLTLCPRNAPWLSRFGLTILVSHVVNVILPLTCVSVCVCVCVYKMRSWPEMEMGLYRWATSVSVNVYSSVWPHPELLRRDVKTDNVSGLL